MNFRCLKTVPFGRRCLEKQKPQSKKLSGEFPVSLNCTLLETPSGKNRNRNLRNSLVNFRCLQNVPFCRRGPEKQKPQPKKLSLVNFRCLKTVPFWRRGPEKQKPQSKKLSGEFPVSQNCTLWETRSGKQKLQSKKLSGEFPVSQNCTLLETRSGKTETAT